MLLLFRFKFVGECYMLKINELKTKRVKPRVADTVNQTRALLENAIISYFQDKSLFNISEDLFLYEFDDYTLTTNTFEDITHVFYLEIDQVNNFKETFIKKNKMVPDLFLSLEKIKDGLFESVVKTFSDNSLIYMDKYSININSNYLINESETKNYYFKLIPCLTYRNANGVEGVKYYTNDFRDVEIEYPKIAEENFIRKNEETQGAFLDSILIFKNIFSKQDKSLILPTEIFETILYNVPNSLFNTNFTQSALSIINYLRNKNMRDYLTIDEQDYAFVSNFRSMSLIYAKRVISIVSNYIKSHL